MTASTELDLQFTGTFSLDTSVRMAAQASFITTTPGTGPQRTAHDLVFTLDRAWAPIAVRLHQRDEGVHANVLGNPAGVPDESIRLELERILSLDRDGAAFETIGARDQVVGDLQQRFPGLRPVLYPSPYEAAARAIIMHRISRRQANAVAGRMTDDCGPAIEVEGRPAHTFPVPERLAELVTVGGLSGRKVEQLRELGRLAADGRFSRAALREMTPESAATHLRQLPGIGPFSAELILIRGAGDPDVFPRTELSLHRAMTTAYDLADDPDLDTLEQVASSWRPYRSWVGLLLRHLVE